jgi:hypothetical protein
MINCLAAVCTANLAHGFGKNPHDTTSITAFFACTMHGIHRRSRRQTINHRILRSDCVASINDFR